VIAVVAYGISRIDLVFSLWTDMASFGRAPACYMVINSSLSSIASSSKSGLRTYGPVEVCVPSSR
jgi:hypothetical protein